MYTQPIILSDIPFRIEASELGDCLGRKGDDGLAGELDSLIAEARKIARPKAVYRRCRIEGRRDDETVIEGVVFAGRVLRVNLDAACEVYAYVATCGRELSRWARAISDPLTRYWADAISEKAVFRAENYLYRILESEHGLVKASTMNPGSLEYWPVSEQPLLFGLIGNVEESIGVTLSESHVMSPVKSVSGIRFAAEESFESCALCARDPCVGRKAPYDNGLYDRRYGKKERNERA
jgi:hypothetical protein